MPKEVQQRFHYDAAKGAAYSARQATTQEAFQKQQAELQRKLAEEARKNEQNRVRVAAAVFVAQRGQPIEVISHGAQVDITRHLALGNVTIVDFYADWCGPCRQISPTLEQMA